jgi:hypothetical protein|tara:strand:- start:1416 stop:1604 length:189 start_codon:yes stop_codon:yes gene_type:complete
MLIDRCQANERFAGNIIDNLESILGTYQDENMDETVLIASAVQTAYLFRDVLKKTTNNVRAI